MRKIILIYASAVITSVTIGAFIGYSFGYQSAFELQNANAYSNSLSHIAALQKGESLFANGQMDRLNQLLHRTLQIEFDRLSDFRVLREDTERFVFPRISEAGLAEQVMADALKREKEIRSKERKGDRSEWR